ncbi:rhomboid family intramembrane serine protease [Acinetobacter nectaris]|nr:rhomboid family intramembrane serine protease [Acinetobacter nectaris]MCF9028048.1 rhomboid family intramembrane serine protease [Acinetobacter nectaris]
MYKMEQPLFYKSKLRLQLWWVTALLIAINTTLYLLQISTGVNSSTPATIDAIHWGADYAPLTMTSEPYRIFTCLFFHFGFIHLALNMWSLYIFGSIAEQIYGRRYYISLYILAGITGSLFSEWISIHNSYALLNSFSQGLVPTINGGASGAIMGIGGALTLLAFFPPTPRQKFILSKKTLIIVMLINLSIGLLTPNINNMAHIGGTIMGALLSFIWYLLERNTHKSPKLILAIIFGTFINIMIYLYCKYEAQGVYHLWINILNSNPFN